jgi:Mn2+/Fe2+ NRAMP family transporter
VRLLPGGRSGLTLGVQVMETFFISLAVVVFSAFVVWAFVIEPRVKH